jgi:OmpA-OmpF porin, OOP family
MKNIWLLALLGWMGLATWWYVCKRCNCCASETTLAAPTANPNPYDFDWNSNKINLHDAFGAWKTKLLAGGGMGDTLVIYGNYGEKEANGEALGLRRAEALKAQLLDKWDAGRVVCRAKMLPEMAQVSAPFMATTFDWRKAKINQKESTIISQGNDFIILFPFRSAVKDVDKKVDAFLKDLADKHKSDNSTISVTGHTDNVGEDAPNKALGLARANFIASILVKDGIAKTRISTDSMGETQPVASNDTDEGRHENRRVVISIK